MESHPQNPEFRNNPENFHPCINITNPELQKFNFLNFQYANKSLTLYYMGESSKGLFHGMGN